VKIASRGTLEAFARQEYARRFAVAPPKVRNAAAVLGLGEHRAMRWREHRYIVPPLPWHTGILLFGCAQILADPKATREGRTRAARMIAATAHRLVKRGKLGRPWRNPFRRIPAPAALELADRLLYVPEDVPQPPTAPAASVDLMDGLMEYLRGGYPTNASGLPLSWAHYQYGLRHAGRSAARENLRLAHAARMAWVNLDDWRKFTGELRNAGGW
jgi:hypothetical protein